MTSNPSEDRPSDGHAGIAAGPYLRLRRPTGDRVVGGVAAAIAGWLGVDAVMVRIAFMVLAVLGGAALPLYAAGWLLIPEEGADLSIVRELMRDHRPRH